MTTASSQDSRERVAELTDCRGRLPAHDERHDACLRREPHHERELHLERMLPHVRRRVLAHHRRGLDQRLGALTVERGDAERRLEAGAAKRRYAVEADEVRGPDQDDGVELVVSKQAVRIRGDGARVDQPGVRRNQRDEPAGCGRSVPGGRHVLIHRRYQRIGGSGIPAAGDRGLANGHLDSTRYLKKTWLKRRARERVGGVRRAKPLG